MHEGVWDYEKGDWFPHTNYTPEFAHLLQYENHRSTARYKPPNPPVFLQAINRIDIGTDYPVVRGHILNARGVTLRVGTIELGVDALGPGDSVVDEIRAMNIPCTRIVLTGGRETTMDFKSDTLTIPRNKALSDLAAFFQNGRIRVAPGLPWYPELIEEAMDFIPVESESGLISYRQNRSSKFGHGDIVLAAAMSLAMRNTWWSALDRQASEKAQSRSTQAFATKYWDQDLEELRTVNVLPPELGGHVHWSPKPGTRLWNHTYGRRPGEMPRAPGL
jgi:hypothetical protein